MPLYEYQCESCEHRFEKIQKYTDPAPDACPKCGGTVRKLASSPAIQFKGTGWYITDYAKKSGSESGKSGSGKSDSGEKSDGGGKADSSSDTSSKSEASDKSEKSGTSDKSKPAETTAAKTDTPAAPKTT
jgi:putative FmdB family regulatory protein